MMDNELDALLQQARSERERACERERNRLHTRVAQAALAEVALLATAGATASAAAAAGAPVGAATTGLASATKITVLAVLVTGSVVFYRARTQRDPVPATTPTTVVVPVPDTAATDASPIIETPVDLAPPTTPLQVRERARRLAPPENVVAEPATANTDERVDVPQSREIAPEDLDTLRAEVRLLARARRALADEAWPQCEAALREHSETFPQGLLMEEARALQIIVACRQGQSAANAIASFQAAYPMSAYRRRVAEACASAE